MRTSPPGGRPLAAPTLRKVHPQPHQGDLGLGKAQALAVVFHGDIAVVVAPQDAGILPHAVHRPVELYQHVGAEKGFKIRGALQGALQPGRADLEAIAALNGILPIQDG